MSQTTGKNRQRTRLQEAKDKKAKVQRTVWIGGDPSLLEELSAKEGRKRQLEALTLVRGENATENAADRRSLAEVLLEIENIKEQLKESAVAFVFQPVGRDKYDKLLRDNPPTEEQVAQANVDGEQIGFNPETFPFMLIDASCFEPEHEPGELERWLREDPDDEWNIAEINDLFEAAVSVNTQRTRLNLGKGSR